MFDIQRKEMIAHTVAHLKRTLRVTRPSVDDEILGAHFQRGEYVAMFRAVQRSLHLRDMQIPLRLVHRGGPKAPAWVTLQEPFPRFGSLEYKSVRVPVYVREEFLAQASFESIVVVFAHELSHIVLESTGNELRRSEEAVDITAMMLGYRDFYITAQRSKARADLSRARSPLEAFALDQMNEQRWNVGYLNEDEVRYAASLV